MPLSKQRKMARTKQTSRLSNREIRERERALVLYRKTRTETIKRFCNIIQSYNYRNDHHATVQDLIDRALKELETMQPEQEEELHFEEEEESQPKTRKRKRITQETDEDEEPSVDPSAAKTEDEEEDDEKEIEII